MAQTPSIPSIYSEILNWLSDNNKMGLVDPYMSVGETKLFNEGPYSQEWVNQLQDLAEEALGRELDPTETAQVQDYFVQTEEAKDDTEETIPNINNNNLENNQTESETDLNTEGDLPLDETTIQPDGTTTFNNTPAELSAQMERLYGTNPATREEKLDQWGNPAMNDRELEAWIKNYMPNFTMPENLENSHAKELLENIRKNKWSIDEDKSYQARNLLHFLKEHRIRDKFWEEENQKIPSWGSELPLNQRGLTNVLAPDGQIYRGGGRYDDQYLIYIDKNDGKMKATRLFIHNSPQTSDRVGGHYNLADDIKWGIGEPREDIENIYESDRV